MGLNFLTIPGHINIESQKHHFLSSLTSKFGPRLLNVKWHLLTCLQNSKKKQEIFKYIRILYKQSSSFSRILEGLPTSEYFRIQILFSRSRFLQHNLVSQFEGVDTPQTISRYRRSECETWEQEFSSHQDNHHKTQSMLVCNRVGPHHRRYSP